MLFCHEYTAVVEVRSNKLATKKEETRLVRWTDSFYMVVNVRAQRRSTISQIRKTEVEEDDDEEIGVWNTCRGR